MKLQFIKFSFLFVLPLVLSSCQQTYVVSKAQIILFQYEFINSAGTPTHSGFFIDVTGNVLAYNIPAKWNYPKEDQILTKEEVIENNTYCRKTGIKISAADLQKHINYIDNIAASKVTSPKTIAADSAISSWYCYQYSDNSATYKRTIIKTEGRSECENLNFFSKKTVLWMNEIRNRISQ
jgi:hypothetical protein